MAKASKPSPTDVVMTPDQEAIHLAEMLRQAGVDPAKAVEIVNNREQYASAADVIRAAGLDPAKLTAPRAGEEPETPTMPSKYEGFPNATNAWNWYIAHGYAPEMVELWLDDRINRGGLYKDSRTLITSYNPRALMKVPAARLATI